MAISESQLKAALKRIAAKETKRVDLHDGGARGAGRLFLRVSSSGATFYAVYWRAGRRIMARIGVYDPERRQGGLTLAAARKKFQVEFAPAIVSGGDPGSVVARRARQESGGTVRQLFEAYVASLRAEGKRSAEAVERMLLLREDNAATAIGARKAPSAVVPQDIVPYLAELHSRGSVSMAAVVRSYISAAFAFGMKAENDYTKQSAGADWGITVNPVAAIPADGNSTSAGDRFLTPSELRTFWLWCEGYASRSRLAPAPRLMMATGQRVEEILRISETVYERPQALLYWEKTKNTLPHAIPLPKQAVEILNGLWANAHGWFFPHRSDPKRHAKYTSPNEVVRQFLGEYPDFDFFTPRDLRRTWKTLAGDAGISKEMRDRLQNHAKKSDVSARHYDRYDYLSEKRAAMLQWSVYLDRVLAGEITEIGQRDAVVVPIGKGEAA
jgi:integrase